MDCQFAGQTSSKVLAMAALLTVAVCSYSLGSMHGASTQQYTQTSVTTARTTSVAPGFQTNRVPTVVPMNAIPQPIDSTGSIYAAQPSQGYPVAATITVMGTILMGALAYVWNKTQATRKADALAMAHHGDIWRTAALELEQDFPGPGNPEDEFEVVVVWGGEERTLKIKGDQSILMACEEAGLDVPYLCRHGVCLECTGKVEKGVEFARRDSQCHNSENVADGYVCTCSTYVGGNGMKVQMGMMEEAYKKQFGKFEAEEREREEKKKKGPFGF